MDSETKLDPAALWMKFCLEWVVWNGSVSGRSPRLKILAS